MTLEQFKKLADRYAMYQYFIGLDDMQIDSISIQSWFDSGDSPESLIEHFACKWGLDNRFVSGFTN